MPLLVLVKQENETFNTQVYVKATNPGHCLNGNSECPQSFKYSTIRACIRRTTTHCSTWQQVNEEIERPTQVLVNNGFSTDGVLKQPKKSSIACTSKPHQRKKTTSTYTTKHTSQHLTKKTNQSWNRIYRNLLPYKPWEKTEPCHLLQKQEDQPPFNQKQPQREESPYSPDACCIWVHLQQREIRVSSLNLHRHDDHDSEQTPQLPSFFKKTIKLHEVRI